MYDLDYTVSYFNLSMFNNNKKSQIIIWEEAASPKPHSHNTLHCAAPFPQKLPLPMWESGPNIIRACLGPPSPPPETASRSSRQFFTEFTVEAAEVHPSVVRWKNCNCTHSYTAAVHSHATVAPHTNVPLKRHLDRGRGKGFNTRVIGVLSG